MSIPTLDLNNGTGLPAVGFGTYTLKSDEGIAAIASAIDVGYRLLDSAMNYENEAEVGAAVRAASVDREELLVTSKLPGRHHGFTETIASLEQSLQNLGLDYVDLYLIHWPLPRVDKYLDSWRAMIELRDRGLVRSIGVSNFTPTQLTRLIEETGVTPAVNQVELHPKFPQAELRAFHREHGIVTESWSPLGNRSDITSAPIITAIAEAHGRTPTQVVLRWHTQLGAIPIPKSANPQRQRENINIFDFELTESEIAQISSLETGRLWGGDPDTHEEF